MTWAFETDADAAQEPDTTLAPSAAAELVRRKNYLRRIHAGHQPARRPHFSYFRLGLLREDAGLYVLTDKALELYINADDE